MESENKPQRKPFVLHGYIEQVGENDFFAICLTVNVCTKGRSLEEAEQNLHEATNLYLEDATKEDHVEQWIPRRAPLYHYLRYLSIWIRTRLRILPPYDAQLMARIVHA